MFRRNLEQLSFAFSRRVTFPITGCPGLFMGREFAGRAAIIYQSLKLYLKSMSRELTQGGKDLAPHVLDVNGSLN
jgi:hypothetical protein